MLFIIAVVIIAVVLIAAWREIPNINSPLSWVVPVLILLVAALLVARAAGVS